MPAHSSKTPCRAALGVAALAGCAALLVVSGCGNPPGGGRKDETPVAPSPPPPVPTELLGVWTHASGKGTRYYPKLRLTFNERGIVTLGDADRKDEWVASYRADPNRLLFSDRHGNTLHYDIGQLSGSDLLLGDHTLRYVGGLSVLQGAFTFLEGRWRHECDTGDGGVGPTADAKRLVRRIEALLARTEAQQKAALAERDGWAAKLRSAGVWTPADLKGNARGRVIAENVVTLANEIEGRDRQLADLDAALLKANSLVRKLESKEATLTDAERRALAVQLKDVDGRTDRVPLPVTPLDVEAAVGAALNGSAKTKTSDPK